MPLRIIAHTATTVPGLGTVYVRDDGYIGRTQRPAAVRAEEHEKATGYGLRALPDSEKFNTEADKALETYMIEKKGIENLPNKYRSTSRSNPKFESRMARGEDLYQKINAGRFDAPPETPQLPELPEIPPIEIP